MPNQFKSRVIQQMLDVLLCAGKKVVETDDFVTLLEKPIGQVRPQKTGTAGNEHALANVVGGGFYSHKTGYYQSLRFGIKAKSVFLLTGYAFDADDKDQDLYTRVATMRTTITLEDELVRELRERARETSRSFKDVVNDAVRLGLRALEYPPLPARHAVTPASMGHPKAGVTLQRALKVADSLEEAAIMQKLQKPELRRK